MIMNILTHINNLIQISEGSAIGDMLLLAVNHTVFEDIDFESIKDVMRGNVILDTRNYLDKDYLESIGFVYRLLGDGNVN